MMKMKMREKQIKVEKTSLVLYNVIKKFLEQIGSPLLLRA